MMMTRRRIVRRAHLVTSAEGTNTHRDSSRAWGRARSRSSETQGSRHHHRTNTDRERSRSRERAADSRDRRSRSRRREEPHDRASSRDAYRELRSGSRERRHDSRNRDTYRRSRSKDHGPSSRTSIGTTSALEQVRYRSGAPSGVLQHPAQLTDYAPGVVLNANLKPPTLSLDSSEAASTFIADYGEYRRKGGLTTVKACLEPHVALSIFWKAESKGLTAPGEEQDNFFNRNDVLERLRSLYAADNVSSSADIALIICERASIRPNDPDPYPKFTKALFSRIHVNKDPPRTVAKQLVEGVKKHHSYLYQQLRPLLTAHQGDNWWSLLKQLHLIASEHFRNLENAKRIHVFQQQTDKAKSQQPQQTTGQESKRPQDAHAPKGNTQGQHKPINRNSSSTDSTNAGTQGAPDPSKKDSTKPQGDAQKPKPPAPTQAKKF